MWTRKRSAGRIFTSKKIRLGTESQTWVKFKTAQAVLIMAKTLPRLYDKHVFTKGAGVCRATYRKKFVSYWIDNRELQFETHWPKRRPDCGKSSRKSRRPHVNEKQPPRNAWRRWNEIPSQQPKQVSSRSKNSRIWTFWNKKASQGWSYRTLRFLMGCIRPFCSKERWTYSFLC